MIPFCDLRPHLTRLFLLAQPQTEFYYFPLHSQSAASLFAPHSPNGTLFLTLHILRPRAIFTLEKHQRKFYYFSLHSQSAAPFSPSKSTKENFIFNSAFPVCRDLFYPRAVPNGILFSHSTSIPPQPRPEAPALHYNIFGLIGRLSPRGAQGLPTCRIHPTIVPEMRCAAPKRRNFPARKRYCRHKSGCRDGHTR